MVDGEISHHSFQVLLRPGRQGSENDGADGQPQQPGRHDFDFVREKRQKQPDEAVDSHLRKKPGQHHGNPDRRGLVGIGQPCVEGKERDLHGQSEENSGESEPGEATGEQPAFSEHGQLREVEGAPGEIDPEEREQHGHAAEERVNEKFGGRAVAIFAAPDFDEKERRHQAHFVEQEPEHEILRGERAVEGRLGDEHERAKTAAAALRAKSEGHNQGSQQDEQQTEAINAHEIFRSDGRDPGVTFHQLQARRTVVEFLPQHQGVKGGERAENQSDYAGMTRPAHPKSERPDQRNKNQHRDHASHA